MSPRGAWLNSTKPIRRDCCSIAVHAAAAGSVDAARAAFMARQAAKDHSLDGLFKANGQIDAACEASHAKFKPDVSSQGMFMHIRPGTGLNEAKPAPK